MTARRSPRVKAKAAARGGRVASVREPAPHSGRAHHGDAETRERLLRTALELFAERGFAKVTVRDICREAQANVAAVSYHFGDKLGLYKEAVRGALATVRHLHDETMSAPASASAEERLRHYVCSYLPLLVRPHGDTEWVQKLMCQEIAEPTPVARWIFEQVVLPRVKYLSAVMAELLDCGEDDERVNRCVISVQAQCLFYLRDPFKSAVLPGWAPADDAAIAATAEHVAEFSLAGVRAARKESKRPLRP
jgi:TetR/AcrR family transcriptional regulator, regulator of cefoperazone and chloramphenicol sensitivity